MPDLASRIDLGIGQQPVVLGPRSNSGCTMADQTAGDLIDVREIVGRPAREQLRKRDFPEFGMRTRLVAIRLGQGQSLQPCDIFVT